MDDENQRAPGSPRAPEAAPVVIPLGAILRATAYLLDDLANFVELLGRDLALLAPEGAFEGLDDVSGLLERFGDVAFATEVYLRTTAEDADNGVADTSPLVSAAAQCATVRRCLDAIHQALEGGRLLEPEDQTNLRATLSDTFGIEAQAAADLALALVRDVLDARGLSARTDLN